MNIQIQHLIKNYGKLSLFQDLNLSIESGKITCLYGTSGCGKTTIINIIGLIENYQSGTILYDGRELKSAAQRRKMLQEKIGFIFQDFGLIENETVLNNLRLCKKIKRMREAEIQDVLDQLQLPNILHRKVYELSGGEQQRIAIAKIVLKDPDLILADEPTASLDSQNKEIILKLLRELADAKKTVILVSHDQEMIRFADCAYDLAKIKGERA